MVSATQNGTRLQGVHGHANGHSNGHSNGGDHSAPSTSSTLFDNLGFDHDKNAFYEQPRPFRVVCIGAGFSGVYLSIRAPQLAAGIDLTIYEKNSKVGGTWFENVYPGAACDIPSHRYAYTFELKPDWKNFYSGSDEIQQYIEDTCHKYHGDQYIKLNHKVQAARWDAEAGKWHLQIEHNGEVFEDSCDVLINAAGPLNNWQWPKIPNIQNYKGTLLHSAAYDRSFSAAGKNIAVVGSGSSSIQIVPTLQPEAKHLTAHLRSNTWITPSVSENLLRRPPDGSLDTRYSEEQIKEFTENFNALLQHRQDLEGGISDGFHLFLKGHPLQDKMRQIVAAQMKERLSKRPELIESMIPNWEVGCRRMTPGIGYLEALCADNVTVKRKDIKAFTETGLELEDGELRDYDAIICATGFDVSHKPRFPLIGRDGYQLDESFTANPYGYMAVAMNNFPNYFLVNGPNAPIGQGSLVPASEQQVDYILKCINKIRRQAIKSMCIQDRAVEHFTRYVDRWMKDAVWTGGCRSWYKNHSIDGRVSALWGGSGLHFIEALAEPRWEDYDYEYLNPVCQYSYFGNGFVEVECNGGNRNAHNLKRVGVMQDHPHLTPQQRQEKKEQGELALAALVSVSAL